ncbi:MAG: hypothetical protein KIG48_01320 [Eubacteriales bacterium]|jgi:hypothetical protein|nr:hypothetical protein [Eubacteriales bacterium]MCI6979794.1 hypothetical protein [Clostridiales bacterium]HZK45211.1 hypothetical protein [Clostridia bacterium]
MTYDVDLNEMKAYILNKFNVEGDFDFLKDGLMEELVDAMMAIDQSYLAKLGEDDDYDDDDAYDLLYEGMQKKYPELKMYAMRLSEDYLDFSEEYLESVGAIEWE